MQLNTILYATDLSSNAEPAFAQAVLLARRVGGTLHMLHVFDCGDETRPPQGQPIPYMEWLETRVRDLTTAAMDRLVGNSGAQDLSIVREQRKGHSIAGQILDYAEQIGADLVVMGTHGRGSLRRLIMGSVATEVLRQSSCHVLTVRQGQGRESTGSINRILVPVSFSEASNIGVARGKELAAYYRADIQLLHVIERIPHPPPSALPAEPSERPPTIQPKALDSLRKMAAEATEPEVECTEYVVEGKASSEIAAFAESHHSDLVVMARHKRVGVIGSPDCSLTETVVRTAPCPVFTFRSA